MKYAKRFWPLLVVGVLLAALALWIFWQALLTILCFVGIGFSPIIVHVWRVIWVRSTPVPAYLQSQSPHSVPVPSSLPYRQGYQSQPLAAPGRPKEEPMFQYERPQVEHPQYISLIA